jgi:hypothetical protein
VGAGGRASNPGTTVSGQPIEYMFGFSGVITPENPNIYDQMTFVPGLNAASGA